jgi:flagellar motor component MotA
LIVVGIIHWRPLYIIGSGFAIIGATMAINQAFTADQSLWPSEFWRYAGAALNALGVLGGTLGIIAAVSALMREAKR